MSHDYKVDCRCYRCKGIRNNPQTPKPRKVRVYREKYASKEEQHARYLDCGPSNWDDR